MKREQAVDKHSPFITVRCSDGENQGTEEPASCQTGQTHEPKTQGTIHSC